jgi:hypothetical protein
MSVFYFSSSPTVSLRRCAELHLLSNDDGDKDARPTIGSVPDRAEVSARERWPENIALMAAVALGLARLAETTITYAPWSGGNPDRSRWSNPAAWSTTTFAAAVELGAEPENLEAACREVADNVQRLVGFPPHNTR